MTNNEEVNSGLLVMGMSNTVFFGQGAVHELVFVNLATGVDFSMQVSEEQAAYLVEQINSDPVVNDSPTKEVLDAGEKSAWGDSETTPQL